MRPSPAIACVSAFLPAALFFGAARGHADPFVGPVQILHGTQVGSGFGLPVAGAGDVDGDGFDDVIICAYAWDGAAERQGRIFVHRGRPEGITDTPSWTVGSSYPGAMFGFAAAGAGDVDGDGYDDIIVGAPNDSVAHYYEGQAFLFRGTPAGLDTVPAWTARGGSPFAIFGWGVGPAGDVNGDGYPDVAVSAGRKSNGSVPSGAAYVYYGSPSGLSAKGTFIPGLLADEWFGFWIEGAGDVNGDGFDDLIVGAIYSSHPEHEEGRAYLYLGSASGIGTTPAWIVESDDVETQLGYSLDGAGDLDADGYDDLIVSAHHFPNLGPGAVFVYYGAPGGPPTTPDRILYGIQKGSHFGQSTAGLGDVDGDGYDDFIVGVYNHSDGQFREGRLQLFRGGSDGVDPSPAWTFDGNITLLGLGASSALAGDVNGDGAPDLIAGSSPTEAAEEVPGAVYLFLGMPPVVSAPAAQRDAGDRLETPAPTPFSHRTTLAFTLAAPGRIRFGIHDLAGRRVRTLIDRDVVAGAGHAAWDGRSDAGLACPSGVYLARLETRHGVLTRRVIFVR